MSAATGRIGVWQIKKRALWQCLGSPQHVFFKWVNFACLVWDTVQPKPLISRKHLARLFICTPHNTHGLLRRQTDFGSVCLSLACQRTHRESPGKASFASSCRSAFKRSPLCFSAPANNSLIKENSRLLLVVRRYVYLGWSRSAVSLSINWLFSLPTQTLLVEQLGFIHFGSIVGQNFKILVHQDFLGLTSALKHQARLIEHQAPSGNCVHSVIFCTGLELAEVPTVSEGRWCCSSGRFGNWISCRKTLVAFLLR